MDYLFTPWRYQYITSVAAEKSTPEACLFCEMQRANDDAAMLIVHRGPLCLVALNKFPYTSGHIMIAPYAHVDELRKLDRASAQELMTLAQHADDVLRKLYKPDGLNFGINLGRAAGAGVAGHIHLHALPRWFGDTNFMTATAETRVLPESLEQTYERMKKVW
jgi:ATP adenylyltransferase